MSSLKRTLDHDPEYDEIPSEVQEKRMKVIETDMRKRTEKKIISIVETQFAEEIANKDSEIDKIDDLLQESRSVLERLRACIVVKYYTQEELKGDESTPGIHPALKPFLEKVPKYHFSSSGDNPPSSTADEIKKESGCGKIETLSRPAKIDEKKVDETPVITPKAPRVRTKYGIVIGNVSKFIPASRRVGNEDMTHLWKVYVRENKGFSKLDTIVKKVCFLLHPSFRPNDIIEVTEAPFEVSRRGWGDFPIRVQLHFKDPSNKPVDIIHQLKLDKTYTGLTTLGPETHVEMQLLRSHLLPGLESPVKTSHESLPSSSSAANPELTKSPKKKEDSILSPLKIPSTSECNGLEKVSSPPIDHDAVKNQQALSLNKVATNSASVANKAVSGVLLNGTTPFVKCTDNQGRTLLVPQSSLLKLKPSSTSESSEKAADGTPKAIPVNKLPLYILKIASSQTNKTNQRVLLVSKSNDLKVKFNKSQVTSPESTVNGICSGQDMSRLKVPGNELSTQLTWHQALRNIDVTACGSFEATFNKVIHLFPIIQKCETDRSIFPFSSISSDDYLTWNIGKRRASEWQRASMIRTAALYLVGKRHKKGLKSFDVWSRKRIMLLCRRYGYTPQLQEAKNVPMISSSDLDSSEICTLSDSKNFMQELASKVTAVSKEEEVDVESSELLDDVETNVNKTSSVHQHHDYSMNSQILNEPHSSLGALFVKEIASQICIPLKPVEFEPGIAVPVLEEMLLSVCKAFTEDIVRSSVNQSYLRTNGKGSTEVSLSDVYLAVKDTPSFSFLTNKYLGVVRDQHMLNS